MDPFKSLYSCELFGILLQFYGLRYYLYIMRILSEYKFQPG